jgi:hypothetical protein
LSAAALLNCYFECGHQLRLVQRVVDISPRGVGLLLPVPVRPDERLRLLPGKGSGPLFAAVLWRVAHGRAAGENLLIRGPFEEPLSAAAYRRLVG